MIKAFAADAKNGNRNDNYTPDNAIMKAQQSFHLWELSKLLQKKTIEYAHTEKNEPFKFFFFYSK